MIWKTFIGLQIAQPDKFRIKFLLLVDVKSKYFSNKEPYERKDNAHNACINLLQDVCLWFVKPYLSKSYIVTIDNYFTYLKFADQMKQQQTTLGKTDR